MFIAVCTYKTFIDIITQNIYQGGTAPLSLIFEDFVHFLKK